MKNQAQFGQELGSKTSRFQGSRQQGLLNCPVRVALLEAMNPKCLRFSRFEVMGGFLIGQLTPHASLLVL